MAGVGLELSPTQKPGPGPGPGCHTEPWALMRGEKRGFSYLLLQPRGWAPTPDGQAGPAEGCGLASAGLSSPGPASAGKALAGWRRLVPQCRGPARYGTTAFISQTNLASPSLCAAMATLLAVLTSSRLIVAAGPSGAARAGLAPGRLGVLCAKVTWTASLPEIAPERRGLAGRPAARQRPPHAWTCRKRGARARRICAATSRSLGPELAPRRSAPPASALLAPRGPPRSGQAAPAFAQPAVGMCRGGREACGGQRRK